MSIRSRVKFRWALEHTIDKLKETATGDDLARLRALKYKDKTKLMNLLQEKFGDEIPSVPSGPDPAVPVKHPLLLWLFDHRAEILAFVLQIVKLFS